MHWVVKRSWTSIWAKGVSRGLAVLRKAAKPARKRAAARKPLATRKAATAFKAKPAGGAGRGAARGAAGGAAGGAAVGAAVLAPPWQRTAAKGARAIGQTGGGGWSAGVAVAQAGARRYKLYRPPGLQPGEQVPMVVMLHGCGQDAMAFAASTRMNQIAARERFIVLYPEQDRLANPQGCWNWFDTRSGRAFGEAALVMAAVEQACVVFPVDRERVVVAGLSAGASMAALLVTRYPQRFKAVVMHAGIPPGTAHSTLTALRAMHGHRVTAPLQATASAMLPPLPPLLVIHGVADNVVAVRNGRAAAQVWADAFGARATAERTVQRGKRYAMQVTDFKHQGRTVATLAVVDHLGHAWSGGAATAPFSDAQGPDASRMVWAFAAKQFCG